MEPLEEARLAFFNSGGELSKIDLSNKEEVQETLTLHKAQLLRSSKIINSLKDKLFQLESEKADGLVKITNLESDVSSLEDQVLAVHLNIESLKEKVKGLEAEKKGLEEENADLKQQVNQREENLGERTEHINSLLKLVTEIDLSVNDVEKLVELGRSLALGEEPSVSTLLGLGEDLEMQLEQLNNSAKDSDNNLGIASSCLNYDPNDPEWTLERLVKVRKIRRHLSNLRDVASDLYTDMLGGKAEGCKVQ